MATAAVFVPGMLQTATPRARAASRSIVFTPTPIFWTRRSCGAFANTCAPIGFSTCRIAKAEGRSASKASSALSEITCTASPSACHDLSFAESFGPASQRAITDGFSMAVSGLAFAGA